MKPQYRIMILEDSREDAELIERELHKGGIEFVSRRAETKEEFVRELREFKPDVILADCWLNDFDGLSALRLARVLEIRVPFILITGSTNEEVAVECIKAGASDYILKDRMARLAASVRSVLEVRDARAGKAEAEERLKEGETRLRQISEHMLDLISLLDMDLRYSYASPQHQTLFGIEAVALLKKSVMDLIHPDDHARIQALAQSSWLKNSSATTELRLRAADGTYRWFEVAGTPMTDERRVQTGVVLASRDISDRKAMEDEARRQQASLSILSDTAMRFVDVPIDSDMYQFVAERIREMFSHAIVIVNAFDPATGEMKTKSFLGTDSILQRLLTVLGKNPIGALYHPDEKTKQQLLLGRLITMESGLGELIRTHVPHLLSRALESMLEIQGAFSIGLVQHDHLLGSIVIITRERDLQVERSVIEAFASQASIALQRRQAEKALKESEGRFRQLVETSPDGIIVLDLDAHVMSVNARAVALFGYADAAAIVGKKFYDLIAPDDRPRAMEAAAQTISEGLVRDQEFRLRRCDDSEFWSESSTSLVADADGRPSSVMVVLRDVTVRKGTEGALRESEQRFRELSDLLPQTVFEADPTGRLVFANQSGFSTFGYSDEDMRSGVTIAGIVAPADRERALENLHGVMMGVAPTGNEYLAVRKDGTQFPALVYAAPVRRAGAVVGMRGLVVDISERKLAEASLRTSEKRHQILVEQANDAIVLSDMDTGIILEVNSKACELTGRALGQLLGLQMTQLFPADELDRHRFAIRRILDEGSALLTDLHVVRVGGKLIPVEINARMFKLSERRAMLSVFRDATERIHLESVRKDTVRQLDSTTADIPSRDEANNVLMVSEHMTHMIVQHSPTEIAVFDREMRYIIASDSFIRNNGLDANNYVGRSHYVLVPGLPDSWSQVHRRCLAGAVERSEEEPFVRSDGSVGYSRWECRPWYNPVREIGGIVLYVEDITSRKMVEERLRIISRAVEQSPNLVMITDTTGKLEYVNSRFCQVTGYTYEEVIGTNPRFLKSGLTQSDDYRNLWETIRSGKEWKGEFLNRKKNNELFFESATIQPILDDAGRITHYLAVKEDITARKRIEQSLEQSEERYRTFFHEDLAGAFIAKPDGALVMCNPAFARIFGFQGPEEATRHSLFSLIPSPAYRESLLQRLRSRKKLEYEKLNCSRTDGKPIHLLQSVSGTFNERGELTEIKGSVIDTTEDRIGDEQERLAQKMESLGTLAGVIAHDFNNILNNVLGFAGQIRKYASDPAKVQRYGETIERSALRGAELAMKLMTIARRKKRNFTPADVRTILEEVEKTIQDSIPSTITMEVTIDPDLPQIQVDRDALVQTFVQLCQNAIEAMPHGGRLSMEASLQSLGAKVSPRLLMQEAKSALVIRISDTGEGIAVERQDKIFEPFYTTRDREKGSGMGLAIAFNVIRDHGGSLQVESEEGKGTTMTAYVPPMGSIPHQEELRTPLAQRKMNNELILLVDDEEPMQELGRELLEEIGCRVLIANDGIEAIETYKNHPGEISLVILDLVMPRMDGGQTYVELKKIDKKVKAVFCSGYTSEKVISALLTEENLRAIQKPFHPADFVRIVQEVIEQD